MLSHFDAKTFMNEYWQKQPLLMRQAIPGFTAPFSAEELAGLACEEYVDSRIIRQLEQAPWWQLAQGPFNDDDFSCLPETHWTLLVQNMEQHVPQLSALLDHFNFLPAWRIDDLMVSYAPQHGSVGPHTDEYDVFLLQGMGRRKWMINPQQYNDEDFIDDLPLKILREFNAQQEWVLEPGDMLYLPPGVAHHGVALDDCMTFSIGFRAPSHGELLTAFVDDLAPVLDDSLRYRDAGMTVTHHSGELSDQAIANVQSIMQHYINDTEQLRQWFGRFITQAETDDYACTEVHDLDELDIILQSNRQLYRHESSRFAYHVGENTIDVYINGQHTIHPHDQLKIIQAVCDHRVINCASLREMKQAHQLLLQWFNQGYVYIDD